MSNLASQFWRMSEKPQYFHVSLVLWSCKYLEEREVHWWTATFHINAVLVVTKKKSWECSQWIGNVAMYDACLVIIPCQPPWICSCTTLSLLDSHASSRWVYHYTWSCGDCSSHLTCTIRNTPGLPLVLALLNLMLLSCLLQLLFNFLHVKLWRDALLISRCIVNKAGCHGYAFYDFYMCIYNSATHICQHITQKSS